MTEPAQIESPLPTPELIDRALEAALALAADRPWGEISLKQIAASAGVPFADLYARVPGKRALLERLSRRLDLVALAKAAEESETAPAHDRLFEAVMARVEAMEPHRRVLIAIARAEGALAFAPRFPLTAKALLEGAGIDTSGARGAARVAAVAAVWARTVQVWRDDEGALNRTMAEIDRRLKSADKALARISAGWSG